MPRFTPEEYREGRVTLARAPGFGFSPDYTLAISGDGWVVYRGQSCVEVVGKREECIGSSRAIALLQLLVIQGFESLDSYYSYDSHITDLDTTSLTLEIGGEVKRVGRYGCPPSVPRRLLFLEDQVDRGARSWRWVGAAG